MKVGITGVLSRLARGGADLPQLLALVSVRDLWSAMWTRAAAARRFIDDTTERWLGMSLARQFVTAAAAVILLAMTAIGSWVARNIEDGVTSTSAAAAALYMDAIVGPLVQELASGNAISPANRSKLREILAQKEIRSSIVSIKIWARDGTIAYSNSDKLIGHTYAPTRHLKAAWGGNVSADFDKLSHEDDHEERKLGLDLFEIYAPMREAKTNRIIAVSEFYVRADSLHEALARARLQSWGVVAATALTMILALYTIVRRGSRTILEQQQALIVRAAQNAQLRDNIERAYWRADTLNEQFLRRLGADLHDGPAQLLGFALMSLDDLPLDERKLDGETPEAALEPIYKALEDAIREIRNLSRGLLLPELDNVTLNETVRIVARSHEERTGSKVALDLPDEPIEVGGQVRVCVYRFIQEALSNAFKHAAGRGQRVECRSNGLLIEIVVRDLGPGIVNEAERSNRPIGPTGLGLVAIRDRIETLGGSFEIKSTPSRGTILRAVLDGSRTVKIEV